MPQATIQSERIQTKHLTALRARANTNRIDLDRASMAHSYCLPDMLTVRGFCQLMDYLQTEDCYKRYGIQKQARCTRCHVPLEQCECQG